MYARRGRVAPERRASAEPSASRVGRAREVTWAAGVVVGHQPESAAMIPRYTRPEIGAVWTDQAKLQAWRDVEVAAAEALTPDVVPGLEGTGEGGEGGGPSPEDLDAIRAATFTVEAVQEREKITDHDVAAFVDVLSASAGESGRWIHYGLTSSDVLDTALALQLRKAGEIVVAGAQEVAEALAAKAREHVHTVCVGRTHGIHAEPTTFGIKLAGFALEADRNAQRLAEAFDQVAVGALSGAVGTYASTSPAFEAKVLERLELQGEPVSTQVIPRDRHAQLLQAISLAGAGLERLATEIRHLQRTEVREAEEPFRAGKQKGSSAMPHKRNPITTERITGLARVLRGYAQAAVENVALWHERDISHSGAERVILPDATIALDYMQSLAVRVVSGLVVHEDRMRENLEITSGALFSQRLLLALVKTGMVRDDAYRIAQELAQRAWDTRTPLRQLAAADERCSGLDLDAVFDLGHYTKHADELVGRLADAGL
jgi:adenylosuccinate lyase